MNESITMNDELTGQWDDIFSDLEPVDPFEVKIDEIAAELSALLVHSEKTRTCIANELQWPKSRVTRVLSGKANLTLKTIWDFASKLDYEFDIVYRKSKESRALQPWHVSPCLSATTASKSSYVIFLQSAAQVAQDFQCGREKSLYFSICSRPGNTTSMHAEPLVINTSSQPTLSHESSFFKLDLSNVNVNSTEILNIKGEANGDC